MTLNNIANLQYRTKTASCKDIVAHLNKCADCFNPPLYTYVEIDRYGKKMFDNAITFESWDGDNLVGLLAVYYNDRVTKIGFITNISVVDEYQRCGIASNLMKNAIEFGKKNAFVQLILELNVDNEKAINLYKKNDFTTAGKNKNNVIMSRLLSASHKQ